MWLGHRVRSLITQIPVRSISVVMDLIDIRVLLCMNGSFTKCKNRVQDIVLCVSSFVRLTSECSHRFCTCVCIDVIMYNYTIPTHTTFLIVGYCLAMLMES